MKVIKNFLTKEDFEPLQKLLMSSNFPWFYSSQINYMNDKPDLQHYMYHLFYKEHAVNSDYFEYLSPLIVKLKINALIRIKANLYPYQPTIKEHDFHVDFNYPHKVALFAINNNNGYTRLKGKKIKSRENQIIMFKGNELHASSTCSDQSIRININFNYL